MIKNVSDSFVRKLCEVTGMPYAEATSEAALLKHCGKIAKERNQYYMAMDHCEDSFHITDGRTGQVIFINQAYTEKTGLSKDEVIGKSYMESVKKGIYKVSAIDIALKEKRPITLLQEGHGLNGSVGVAAVTATPVINDVGEIEICVSNARFIDDLDVIRHYYSTNNGEKNYGLDAAEIVSRDQTMISLYEFARRIAAFDSNILITGETGTGKSILARYIHNNSLRNNKPFVSINCSAIPDHLFEAELFGYESGAFTGANKNGKKGFFELADGGTLVLDEIAEMPLSLQAKLLSAIQNKTIVRVGGVEEININVRIITATNRNIEKMVSDGLFREDLYYRINVVPIKMPPLRDRKDDIRALTDKFLKSFAKRYERKIEITNEAKIALEHYPWPGNVRELENYIERLAVTNKTGVIGVDEVMDSDKLIESSEAIKVTRLVPLSEALEFVERALVEMAFADNASTYSAAKKLGISQSGASRRQMKYMKFK